MVFCREVSIGRRFGLRDYCSVFPVDAAAIIKAVDILLLGVVCIGSLMVSFTNVMKILLYLYLFTNQLLRTALAR